MKIAICAIMKDVNPIYFKEWVEHHHRIGFDDFIIYDNDSSIPIKPIGDGIFPQQFKIHTVHGVEKQIPSYNDCIARYKGDYDWIAFIDDDEFIIIESRNIKTFIEERKNASAILLNWLMFGPCADEDFDLPQVLKFKKHVLFIDNGNRYVKSIVKMANAAMFIDPHYCLNSGFVVNAQNEIIVNRSITNKFIHKYAWINHYFCRSKKEFIEKIERGRSDSVKINYTLSEFDSLVQRASESNTRILNATCRLQTVVNMRNDESIQCLEKMISVIDQKMPTNKMKMVEIGSYAGESTIVFARHFRKVIAIDPFLDGYDLNDETCHRAPLEKVFEEFIERTKKFSNIFLYRMTSDDAIQVLEKVDFVYIDGCHTYEQVKKDIKNYLPLLDNTAFIGGHDFYVNGFEGVRRAVIETLGMPDYVFNDGSWLKLKSNIK